MTRSLFKTTLEKLLIGSDQVERTIVLPTVECIMGMIPKVSLIPSLTQLKYSPLSVAIAFRIKKTVVIQTSTGFIQT